MECSNRGDDSRKQIIETIAGILYSMFQPNKSRSFRRDINNAVNIDVWSYMKVIATGVTIIRNKALNTSYHIHRPTGYHISESHAAVPCRLCYQIFHLLIV